MRQVLAAMAARAVYPGGLLAATRFCGAEPWLTGRSRPYSEAWLRQRAEHFEARGAVAACEALALGQAEAVRPKARSALVHADMHDAVWWTQECAHAGPIGRLANRVLGAVYFGVTTVHFEASAGPGVTLFLALSVHKPASPLRDALEALVAAPDRGRWLAAHARVVIVDRGANGTPIVQWMYAHGLPYLTVQNGSVPLPTTGSAVTGTVHRHPIAVLPDVRVAADPTRPAPRIVVFPAAPDAADGGGRALCYRLAATLRPEELENLDSLYKDRWPHEENRLKALQETGFAQNRSRRRAQAPSRGHDGRVARLRAQLDALGAKAETLAPGTLEARKELPRLATKATELATALVSQEANVKTKAVRRVEGTGELLWKWLALLFFNRLAIILATATNPAVAALTPTLVRDLLFGRSALGLIEGTRYVLAIERVLDMRQRVLQEQLVAIVNRARLRWRGRSISIRLTPSGGFSPG